MLGRWKGGVSGLGCGEPDDQWLLCAWGLPPAHLNATRMCTRTHACARAHARRAGVACRGMYGLEIAREDDVLVLDSSTPAKFSSHVVVHVPGHAFADNAAAGRFVQLVVGRAGDALHVRHVTDSSKGKIQTMPFVDAAVYSRCTSTARRCRGGCARFPVCVLWVPAWGWGKGGGFPGCR